MKKREISGQADDGHEDNSFRQMATKTDAGQTDKECSVDSCRQVAVTDVTGQFDRSRQITADNLEQIKTRH